MSAILPRNIPWANKSKAKPGYNLKPLPESGRIPFKMADAGNTYAKLTPLDELFDKLASYSADPLGFVLWAFPWGEEGTSLELEDGPEEWQRDQLIRIGERLRDGADLGCVIEEDISSGHGIGKSAQVSWLVLWAIATHADTRGVVTANTDTQLRTKTWAELAKWYQLFIGKTMFKLTATSIFIANDAVREKAWRIDAVPWSKENTEAFAGMHNKGKRILVIFDEAAAIDDEIYTVTEGALTDAGTQIIWARFGNPTRTSGKFFRNCLAEGTLVLTREGWIAIQDVSANATVWDGVEWVHHQGPRLNGYLFTTPVFGVSMTPDHKVLTEQGWMDGQACKGIDRAEVRLPDGFALPLPAQARGDVGANLRMWGHAGDAQRRHQQGGEARNAGFVRLQAGGAATQARDVVSSWVQGVGCYARAVFSQVAQSVEELRRAGNHGLRSVARVFRELLGGHGAYLATGVVVGPGEQRRELRAGQLPLGDSDHAAQQYASEHLCGDAQGALDVGADSPRLRDSVQSVAHAPSGGMVVEPSAGYRNVYDLIDCGPRSRFVVAGADGRALIVHNCTQPKRNHYVRVDARTVRFTNKGQIAAWVEDYGEDSDFVRVRVKGQFPRAGYSNFISPELVFNARRRRVPMVAYQAHQKVIAVDPARFGDDFSVITCRQGLKVHWQIALGGFDGIDLANRVAEFVRKESGRVSCIAYDAIGNGADLDSALRRIPNLNVPLIPVMWGAPAKDDKQYFNQRSECWGRMRDWLENGEIPDEDSLADELVSLDYGHDGRFRIQLQSKKDIRRNGGKSPDRADSLALSFIPDLIDRKITVKALPVRRRTVVWSR